MTLVSYKRICLFGDVIAGEIRLNEIGQIVQEEWQKTQTVRWNILVDEFVIMPNHLHGILFIRYIDDVQTNVGATRRVAPTSGRTSIIPGSLGAIIGQIKSLSTKRINIIRETPGLPVWQRNYYEHIIRNENDLLIIRQYIRDNPLRWDIDHENPLSNR